MTLPRWTLPVSLLLNVFLIGVIATLAFTAFTHDAPPSGRRHGPPNPMRLVERMAETLPSADAAILKEAFARRAAEIQRSQEGMEAMPSRLRAATGAEPFQLDALATAFADGKAARDGLDDAIASAVLDAVSRMSPEGRHKLATWEPAKRPPDDKKPGDHDQPPDR